MAKFDTPTISNTIELFAVRLATIPLEIAGAVADAAAEFAAAEAILLDYLKSGRVEVPGFAAARRGMMDSLAALSRRLRRIA